METMRAIVFEAPENIRVVDDAPIPTLEDGEVLVRCTHIGLCGSNRGPYLGEGVWGEGAWPRVIGWTGHENVGVITQSRHPAWPEGTRVLAQVKGYAGFCEFVVSRWLSRLPDAVADIGPLVTAQPVATVMAALGRTRPVLGERCAVIGQGPIGLIFTYLLRQMGAVQVIAIDRVPWRLEWAKRLGATDVVDASQQDTLEAVKTLTGGELVDFSIEAVGAEETLHTAAHLPRHQGRLCIFGVPDYRTQSFPWWDTTNNETEIVLSRGNEWRTYAPTAIQLLNETYRTLQDIATPRMPFEKAAEAFDMYVHPAAHRDSLKILLEL